MKNNLPPIIVILGPTASGKTAISLDLARKYQTEIISADSRTIYQEMNIGTAKPEGKKLSAAEINPEKIEKEGIHARNFSLNDLFTEKPYLVEGIPHWGIDLISPTENFSASDFKDYAEKHIDQLHQQNKIPLLVGGTGLYISGITDQLNFSNIPPNLELREELAELSNIELIERLKEIDPEAIDLIDSQNRRRLERAIEIIETSKKPWSQQQMKNPPKYNSLQIGISLEKEILYERINHRVDKMIADGLVDEARQLYKKYGSQAPGLNTIGYKQLCAFFDNYISLKDAIDLIKRDSRHYAKRQLTWFKKNESIIWLNEKSKIELEIKKFLENQS